MDIGYARVSTAKQDLDRQIDALRGEGIPAKRIYVDKKSGSTTNRPGLHQALDQARDGDVIVVHTLDRLGRTVRDTLNLIHDLAERGVGVRNLADPIPVNSANPDDHMSQLAVVMLALFGQMERTYAIERAAHARGGREQRQTHRPAQRGRSNETRLRDAPARRGTLHQRDCEEDRHHSLEPLSAPAAPPAADPDRRDPAEHLRPRAGVLDPCAGDYESECRSVQTTSNLLRVRSRLHIPILPLALVQVTSDNGSFRCDPDGAGETSRIPRVVRHQRCRA